MLDPKSLEHAGVMEEADEHYCRALITITYSPLRQLVDLNVAE